MVSKVQPGRAALERMGIYRILAEFSPVGGSYAGKFALAAFIGGMIPLVIFIVYLLVTRQDQQLIRQVDRHAGRRVFIEQADKLIVGFLVDHDRQQSLIERVVVEDTREIRRDHRLEAIALQCPHCVLAR